MQTLIIHLPNIATQITLSASVDLCGCMCVSGQLFLIAFYVEYILMRWFCAFVMVWVFGVDF